LLPETRVQMLTAGMTARHRHTLLRHLLIVCAALSVAGCTALDRRPPPTADEIVAMSAQGMSDEQIITRLRDSTGVHALTAAQIIDLNDRGVSIGVLDYMLRAYVERVRRQERFLYSDPLWMYPCFGCSYPYSRIAPFYVYP